jgi:hypothetical protein
MTGEMVLTEQLLNFVTWELLVVGLLFVITVGILISLKRKYGTIIRIYELLKINFEIMTAYMDSINRNVESICKKEHVSFSKSEIAKPVALAPVQPVLQPEAIRAVVQPDTRPVIAAIVQPDTKPVIAAVEQKSIQNTQIEGKNAMIVPEIRIRKPKFTED